MVVSLVLLCIAFRIFEEFPAATSYLLSFIDDPLAIVLQEEDEELRMDLTDFGVHTRMLR